MYNFRKLIFVFSFLMLCNNIQMHCHETLFTISEKLSDLTGITTITNFLINSSHSFSEKTIINLGAHSAVFAALALFGLHAAGKGAQTTYKVIQEISIAWSKFEHGGSIQIDYRKMPRKLFELIVAPIVTLYGSTIGVVSGALILGKLIKSVKR